LYNRLHRVYAALVLY